MLFISASEWWLRGLDSGSFLGINAPNVFRNGFRLVVFSVIIMVVVLFFSKGIMGDRELPDLIKDWKENGGPFKRRKNGTPTARDIKNARPSVLDSASDEAEGHSGRRAKS